MKRGGRIVSCARWSFGFAALIVLGSCTAVPPDRPQAHRIASTPVERRATPRPVPAPRRDTFGYSGAMIQGGLVVGIAPGGTSLLVFDGTAVPVAPDGRFVIGFDRDAGPAASLAATLDDGRTIRDTLTVAPRGWDVSRLNGLPKLPVPQPRFDRLRPGELAQIAAARRMQSDAQGWRQAFLWPATGRISTPFGSQRIYRNNEAGSYHSGIDIAVPQGTPVLSPADGVVILASERPYLLEGNLLMIDHGMGLDTAFMHLSRIDVRVGEHVRRGQPVALSGMTGRATGPHLHWGLKWRDAKIDPLLVAGPMPRAERRS